MHKASSDVISSRGTCVLLHRVCGLRVVCVVVFLGLDELWGLFMGGFSVG